MGKLVLSHLCALLGGNYKRRDTMKAKELTDVTLDIPNANIVIELPNGQRTSCTGFWVQEDKNSRPILVVKSGKKL